MKNSMKYITLGKNGPKVSRIGLGCAGMSEFYGAPNKEQAIQTLQKAIELGVTLFDTADMYGKGENEKLVSYLTKEFRDKIIISSKCGIVRDSSETPGKIELQKWRFDSSPKYIKSACEKSLSLLGTDYIDIYYLHIHDGKTPIEDIVGAFAELVQEGKIKYIGLSHFFDEEVIRKAHKVHPITVIQNEYSIWSRESETIFSLCKDLGIGFVAYSPIGRGLLSGKMQDINSLPSNDLRKILPDFAPKVQKTSKFLDQFINLAKEYNYTPAQLALSWVLSCKTIDVIPIPGTKNPNYLEENIKALEMPIKQDLLEKLSNLGS